MGLISKCRNYIRWHPVVQNRRRKREKRLYIRQRNQRYPQLIWQEAQPCPQKRVEAARMQVGSKLFVFGGYITLETVSRRVDLFDLETQRWQQIGTLPVDAAETHNGTVYDGHNHIYLIGGQLGPSCSPVSANCFVFDIRTYQWSKLPPLPEGRYMSLIHLHKGRIHYISGTMPDRCSPADQHWSIGVANGRSTEAEWTSHAPISSPRTHTASYLHNDEMFVFGGQTGDVPPIEGNAEYLCNFNTAFDEVFNEVYTYNLVTGEYQLKEPMPEKLSHSEHAVVRVGSKIIIAGGVLNRFHLSDLILSYDLNSGQWSEIGRLPYPMKSKVTAYWNGRIYIVTGQRSESELDLTPGEVLDTVWHAPLHVDLPSL